MSLQNNRPDEKPPTSPTASRAGYWIGRHVGYVVVAILIIIVIGVAFAVTNKGGTSSSSGGSANTTTTVIDYNQAVTPILTQENQFQATLHQWMWSTDRPDRPDEIQQLQVMDATLSNLINQAQALTPPADSVTFQTDMISALSFTRSAADALEQFNLTMSGPTMIAGSAPGATAELNAAGSAWQNAGGAMTSAEDADSSLPIVATPTSEAGAASNPGVPVVTGISPSGGPNAGGTTVTITGSGFTGATEVDFDGASATFTVVSDTEIIATSPEGEGGGEAPVTVATPLGTSLIEGNVADGFLYAQTPVTYPVPPPQ